MTSASTSGMLGHILVVDDEPHALKSFELTLKSCGYNHVLSCSAGCDVMNILADNEVELILLDLVMPDISGEKILEKVTFNFPQIPVIMVTGTNKVETAVRCIQKGAFDYILKPVERDKLLPAIKRAVEMSRLRRENERLTRRFFSSRLEHPDIFSKIITVNPEMKSIFRYCEAIGPGSFPVLITGETGVGKDLIAEAIHQVSGRCGAYVAINAAGLDDNIFSDTLFGHVKGAYTNATTVRTGQIETAAGGTLFLDEIGDLSPHSQVKLLRLLDKNEYYPLGSDAVKLADVRFLFATHTDLVRLVREGRFREDLYYRLRTHCIHIPPLRDRIEDIPVLFNHFLDAAAQEFNKTIPTCDPALLPLMKSHLFPGNIRELKSIVFDTVGRCTSNKLSASSFGQLLNPSGGEQNLNMAGFSGFDETGLQSVRSLPTIKALTAALIEEAMRRTHNNQRGAAQILGISPQALNQRLKNK